MRLLRGISRGIPEQQRGLPDTGLRWWEAERHHGLGDNARHTQMFDEGESSPRERHPRRPRGDMGESEGEDDDMLGDSHRRRRLLAVHIHEHL